jgi:hypothetical protein
MLDFLMRGYDSFVAMYWLTVALWDSGAIWTINELVRAAPERFLKKG